MLRDAVNRPSGRQPKLAPSTVLPVLEAWRLRRRRADIRKWTWYVFVWVALVGAGAWSGAQAGATISGLYVGLAVVFGCLLYATVFLTRHLMWAVSADEGAWAQDEARIRRLVAPICEQAGMRQPRVFIIPDASANACAAGVFPRRQYIGVTRGALYALADDELSGVLAHEVTHLQRKDPLFTGWWIALTGLVIAIAAVTIGIGLSMVLSDTRRARKKDEGSGAGGGLLLVLFGVLFGIVAWFTIQTVLHAMMRKSEYLADNGAVLLTGRAQPLISALRKMEQHNQRLPPILKRSALAMVFSVDPLPHSRWTDRLFATHPHTGKRIQRLEQWSRDLGEWQAPRSCENRR